MDEKAQEGEQGDDLGNHGRDTGMAVQSSLSCTMVADIPQTEQSHPWGFHSGISFACGQVLRP